MHMYYAGWAPSEQGRLDRRWLLWQSPPSNPGQQDGSLTRSFRWISEGGKASDGIPEMLREIRTTSVCNWDRLALLGSVLPRKPQL